LDGWAKITKKEITGASVIGDKITEQSLIRIENHMQLQDRTALEEAVEAGRCTLTPPDPQLKGAWYPGGFNPCTYRVKNRFQNVPFKCNVHRYVEDPELSAEQMAAFMEQMGMHDSSIPDATEGRVGTFHVILQSKHQMKTLRMVHVINLTPGSACQL
jgi:hypothetical protein